MCGIAGYIDITRHQSLEHELVMQKMLDQIIHRGPDARGIWVSNENNVVLGHQRLSILDLSPAGSQPMFSPSGRYTIVFNGEIYNHIDLRKIIEASHSVSWKGTSDTETLLVCIEYWGVHKTLEQTIGMFAFALYDEQERKLILSRDRVGEKPLYFGWDTVDNKNYFLFASDLQSIKLHPAFRSVLNKDALALYFRHNYIPAPYSIYQNIQKLLPGTFLVYDLTRHDFTINNYWSLDESITKGIANPFTGSITEAVNELDQLLQQAIKNQMIADVPLGAFLSGGIDSSTIVAIMQKLSSNRVKTFSIGFEDQEFDESVYAKKVADHLGTEHFEHLVTQKEALEIVPQLSKIFSEPFSDSSQVPTYLVAQLAKQHVTVSLSGDAGDELFGGYNRYTITDTLFAKINHVPHFAKGLASSVIRKIPQHTWNALPFRVKYKNIGEKLYKLADILNVKDPMQLYRSVISHTDSPEKLLINGREPDKIIGGSRNHLELHQLRDIEKMMYLDTLTYLPDDILVKVDRTSMAVSLESRVPFLDHRVIDFAWRLPFSYKINNGQGKLVLKKLLERYVPTKLTDRPKMGFGVPLASWLRGPLKTWAIDLLNTDQLKREEILCPELVDKLLSEHLSYKADHGYLLWDLLMFQSWLNDQRGVC